MISKGLSDKFKLGSLLCTIMVVYRHSLNIQAFGGEERLEFWVPFIETGISKLTEIAVPFFFLLSGFFFFRGSYYKNSFRLTRNGCMPSLFYFCVITGFR